MSKTITIPDELYEDIAEFIQDDAVKRKWGDHAATVKNYVGISIENNIEADKAHLNIP